MHAIKISGLSKQYRVKRKLVDALQDVNLVVGEGEAFGFIGPNGAGKSTTIKALLNVISDYKGEITLYGVNARDDQARYRLGYVPEVAALPEALAPREILRMAIAMHGAKFSDPAKQADKWLERFGIAAVADKRVASLSKGTVQRTALAHALITEPRLLVLDEPLSGLDPIGRADVVEILAEYKRAGGTIFFTSHVLHDVERLADTFGLINKGHLITSQSPSQLLGGQDRYVVRWQGKAIAHAGVKSPESADRWLAEVSVSELWSLLTAIKDAGDMLIEVKPAMSLERIFLSLVSNTAHASQGQLNA